MRPQKHIINRQVFELHMPKTMDTFQVQQQLSVLCKERITPILDKVLCDRFQGDDTQHVQIDSLTIDLGTVSIDDVPLIFEEKLTEELSVMERNSDITWVETSNETTTPQKTPLKIVAYYLKMGVLPWWADEVTKAHIQDQLEQLLKTPHPDFIHLLTQLQGNTIYLERFVNTFDQEQLQKCIQLIMHHPVDDLINVQLAVCRDIQKKKGIASIIIEKTFWKAAFQQRSGSQDYNALKTACVEQTYADLGIDQGDKNQKHQDIFSMRMILQKLKNRYQSDLVWQEFFKEVSSIVYHPSFYQIDAKSAKRGKQECLHLEIYLSQKDQNTNRESALQSFRTYIKSMQSVFEISPFKVRPSVIDTLPSGFEEADFISVQNAGLVLFWPFLQRFFEKLEVMDNASFKDEAAKYKAICALQYVCGEEDTTLFEGAFALNKVLCGVPQEDTILPASLSAEEKNKVDDLLQAVIQRGPHWKNLSQKGFQTSYVNRQGSLRIRDGHWLLQVKKETYDVTLDKLPWGFHTVKLPWMNEILLVEWNS